MVELPPVLSESRFHLPGVENLTVYASVFQVMFSSVLRLSCAELFMPEHNIE
ncbi:hypothetical protein [Acetobacter fabarum]|jgi:hypothetical protein|uniref:hypothetical protein n=1 Tax=Acetobacter fabarum TaxID=483199 RepID=UPI0024331E5C|nr:hypothetical protein [Acetobacter fabarum]MCH4026503.1 hypothetical protein [Acetobacter fabarum]MCH4137122.1 hypothetical protein [Acetobacter fabarum]MCI1322377.1 hypothetical protein [Acetobacter fabarum]